MKRHRLTRRGFLKSTAAMAGAATVTPYFWSSNSRSEAHAQEESPGDRLNVGAIGTSIYADRYTGKGRFFQGDSATGAGT